MPQEEDSRGVIEGLNFDCSHCNKTITNRRYWKKHVISCGKKTTLSCRISNKYLSLAKVDKQKESEEPTSDATPDLSIDVPEAPSLAPTVPPYESTEYEESVTQLLNMIRDTSAACYPHWKELR